MTTNWKHRGHKTWMGKVKYAIDDSLKEIYKDKDLGINHNWGHTNRKSYGRGFGF